MPHPGLNPLRIFSNLPNRVFVFTTYMNLISATYEIFLIPNFVMIIWNQKYLVGSCTCFICGVAKLNHKQNFLF